MKDFGKSMGIEQLRKVICKLGEKLGFEVEREVPASSSAWVDVVWFDKKFRVPKPKSKETLLRVRAHVMVRGVPKALLKPVSK